MTVWMCTSMCECELKKRYKFKATDRNEKADASRQCLSKTRPKLKLFPILCFFFWCSPFIWLLLPPLLPTASNLPLLLLPHFPPFLFAFKCWLGKFSLEIQLERFDVEWDRIHSFIRCERRGVKYKLDSSPRKSLSINSCTSESLKLRFWLQPMIAVLQEHPAAHGTGAPQCQKKNEWMKTLNSQHRKPKKHGNSNKIKIGIVDLVKTKSSSRKRYAMFLQ